MKNYFPAIVLTLLSVGSSAYADFPARRDTTPNSRQYQEFIEPARQRIRVELKTLDWLWQPGFIEKQQVELIDYLQLKSQSKAQIPQVSVDKARDWYWNRHRTAYRTELDETGTLHFVPENAAWNLIYEDMALCRDYLASGDIEKKEGSV